MDFYEYKIGNTPFYQAPELSDWLTVGGRRPIVYVKQEDENEPTHTIKVRPVAAALKQYENVEDGYVLAAITCGHLGDGGAELCYLFRQKTGKDVRFASIVEKGKPKKTRKHLSRYGDLVIEADLSQDLNSSDIIEITKAHLNGKARTIIPIGQFDTDGIGYKALAKELYEAGVRHDWILFFPLGGGNLLYNTTKGFEKLPEMPRFVAATTNHNVFSCQKQRYGESETGLDTDFSPLQESLMGLIEKYNIPRITPSSAEIDEALDFLRHEVKLPTCRESAVAVAAARKYSEEIGFKDGEKVGLINTGYEPEESESKFGRISRYAVPVLNLLLLTSTLILEGDMGKNEIRQSLQKKWSQEWRQYEMQQLSQDPRLNDIYAYALFRGGMKKIDTEVYNNLSYWFTANDVVARDMYKNVRSFRENIEGFMEWMKNQKSAREDELKKRFDNTNVKNLIRFNF